MLKNYIITSFKNADYCKAHYPNKTVEVSVYCPNDDIFYFNRQGKIRRIDLKDKSIWQSVNDFSLGFEFPTGYQVRIR